MKNLRPIPWLFATGLRGFLLGLYRPEREANAEAGLKLFCIPLANDWRHKFDGELPAVGRGFQDQGFRVRAFLENRSQGHEFDGANTLDDACPRDRDEG